MRVRTYIGEKACFAIPTFLAFLFWEPIRGAGLIIMERQIAIAKILAEASNSAVQFARTCATASLQVAGIPPK